MADARIYLGRPGALAAIRSPRGTVAANRDRRVSTFNLGVGGTAVDQMVGGARTYVVSYDQLTRDDWAVLEAYAQGLEGPGPFAFLDPGQRNMLPANISGATSVTNDVAGVRPVGGFELLGYADSFNRTAVASGWGSTERGQAWTVSPPANHSTTGTAARQVLGSVNAYRTATLDLGVADFDVTADVTVDVATASGAGIGKWVAGRYTDANNYMAARLLVGTGGNMTLAIFNRAASTLSAALGTGTATVGTGHTANSVWRIRFTGVGTSFTASAWLRDSETEPSTPAVTATDATITTGNLMALMSRLESGNTNTLPVTVTWDGMNAAPAQAGLTSSSVYTDAGPRSLALTFTSPGVATITPKWPSSVFKYGVPAVAARPIVAWCQLRGGGGDPIATYTMRILWRSATGTLVSSTSGTPVASASGAWAALSATGTPPAGAVYADFEVQYTSGASAGTIAYFRRFQMEEGSTPGTWYPGSGVFPVRFGELPDAWPFLSPELRERPSVALLEDVS